MYVLPKGGSKEIERVRILFLAANPKDTHPLRLGEELRSIDEALRLAEYGDKFDLEQAWAVRVSDLQGQLLRYEPNIAHFSGHGSQASEIILEDATGESHPVTVRTLSNLFRLFKDDIQCVVLNACYSKPQAEAIAEHIDCVIGMSKSIGDAAAINFARSFYQGLGYGRTVQDSFDLGCSQIDLANLNEMDTPQLICKNCDPNDVVFVARDQPTLGTKPTIPTKIAKSTPISELTTKITKSKAKYEKSTYLEQFKKLLDWAYSSSGLDLPTKTEAREYAIKWLKTFEDK